MIRIFISLVFCLMSAFACAQSNQSDNMYQWGKNKANEQLVNDLKSRQKALWKDQRDLQNRIDSVYWDEALDAIKDTTFTFEADKVVFPYGQIAYVNSNTNFVSVNKDDAVVQVAFNVPFSGPNGIGGVTVQGNISGYKIQTDKKGTTQVSMSVTGIGISAQIWITMYKGSMKPAWRFCLTSTLVGSPSMESYYLFTRVLYFKGEHYNKEACLYMPRLA